MLCVSNKCCSDRSLKKLSDNFGCWADKLHSDSVYTSVAVILAGAKKTGVGVGRFGKCNSEMATNLIVLFLQGGCEAVGGGAGGEGRRGKGKGSGG